jgi:beta-glucosidase
MGAVGTGMAKRLLPAVLLAALACGGADAKFSRNSFPKDFIFGTGSAAYQVMN